MTGKKPLEPFSLLHSYSIENIQRKKILVIAFSKGVIFCWGGREGGGDLLSKKEAVVHTITRAIGGRGEVIYSVKKKLSLTQSPGPLWGRGGGGEAGWK